MTRRALANAACAAALIALLGGCGGSDSTWQVAAAEDVTLTLFRPFAAGEYVFRSRAELDAALAAAPFRVWPIGLVTEEPPIPAWDFETQMVVGISLGEGPWCTAPRIQSVSSDGTDVRVPYTAPSSGTLACMHLAPLIAFVRVPRVPGRVVFEQVS
jgi:hypothetical protein